VFAASSLLVSTLAQAGSTIITLTFAGNSRSSVLHVPANYDQSKAYPLVVVFHATGMTGAQTENVSGFDAVADANSFFVAYPDSVGSQWVVTGPSNDVDFSVSLMQTIEAAYHIDPTRVYSAGYSQGAGLAQELAFCNPNLIGGVADVAQDLSAGWQSVCKLTTPIAYVVFHGTADPVSPYNGDATATPTVYSALQTATNWAQIDGCTNQSSPSSSIYPDTLNTGPSVTNTQYAWSGCSNGTTVAFYSITGGGHTWPGGTQIPTSTMGPTSQTTNASQIMWQTFSPHRSAAPFAGVCGAAAGVATSSAPSSGLCRIGLASTVSSGSGWSWTCSGYNGGSAASCAAPLH
ncbi:MAG: hypothetical protein JSR21_10255, partial [Proteobacteria bacterium]|nr:hypothetical protein [Pseudomonadota bacterium]